VFIDLAYGFHPVLVPQYTHIEECNTTNAWVWHYTWRVQPQTWRGVRQQPKGSLAFMGVKHR